MCYWMREVWFCGGWVWIGDFEGNDGFVCNGYVGLE